MYSPEAMPTPTRITLGPTILRSGGAGGSGRSVTGPIFASGMRPAAEGASVSAGAAMRRTCPPAAGPKRGVLYVITYK